MISAEVLFSGYKADPDKVGLTYWWEDSCVTAYISITISLIYMFRWHLQLRRKFYKNRKAIKKSKSDMDFTKLLKIWNFFFILYLKYRYFKSFHIRLPWKKKLFKSLTGYWRYEHFWKKNSITRRFYLLYSEDWLLINPIWRPFFLITVVTTSNCNN